MASTFFETTDMNGVPFWLDYDGAEGHGFWVGDPENSIPLSVEASDALLEWVFSNFDRGEET